MHESDNKKYWQRFSRLYSPFMKISSGLYREICRLSAPYLTKDMDVLELACGTGQLSFPLASRVRTWEATDFSEAMIAQAKKQAGSSRLHFSVQDATALPYAPQTFDAVVISNALHIMPHPDRALKEIRRVLKPGGILIAPTFIQGEGTGFRLRMRIIGLTGFHTYYKWNEAEYLKFLADHGFQAADHKILGGSLAPLCFVAAREKKGRG